MTLFSDPGFANAIRTRYSLFLVAISARRRFLGEMRARWGRAGTKDGWLASRLFELTRKNSGPNQVDDRTWNDLEFPRIFTTLDTTVTSLGSQYLFRQLRTYPDSPETTSASYETARTLQAHQGLREEIQLKLAYLQADSCGYIVDSLFGQQVEAPRWRSWIYIWSALSILLFASVLAFSWPLLLLIGLLVTNVTIIYVTASRTNRLIEALRGCSDLVRAADGLASIRTTQNIPQLTELIALSNLRTKARHAFRWFAFFQNAPLGGGVWLNFLFLLELVAYARTVKDFATLRDHLRALYEVVASLDAATAVASLLERVPDHCRPLVSRESLIEIEAGYHPLLATRTPNSVTLRHRSALISGSNMAGKTTFIKMVGTNIILGHTLGVCFASCATIPPARVMACIRSEHSIESGKSRYFAEIETVLSFLRSAEGMDAPVLVIDEPFSGTNTVERIAIARAVLLALSRSSQVLATTHDVELQQLLAARFDAFHFREDPDIDGYFDYRLRPGECTEGNAVRLLEKIGFPQAIVTEALTFAANYAGRGDSRPAA